MRSFTVRRIFVAMTIASCFFALGNAQDQQDEKKVAAEAVNQPTPDLYLRQWISYGVDGSVEGTVVTYEGSEVAAAPNTTVRLISNGLAKLQTVTNERGEFKLHGVNPGVYSVVASNGRGIAAFSLVVLPGEAGSHLPKSVEIPLVDPAGRGVQKLIPSTFVPGVSSLGMPILADPLGSARRFADSRVISTDANGVLKGRLEQVIGHSSRDYSDMTVYFFQNDRIVKNASVERTGEFSVSGLPSGVYGAVAAGTSGFSGLQFRTKEYEFILDAFEGKSICFSTDKFIELSNHTTKRQYFC